jgi:capsid protein
MLENLRSTLASLIAPPKKRRAARKLTPKTLPAKRPDMSLARMYAAAKQSRLNQGWGQTTGSEDTELIESLVKLRDRSRETCRDSSYAKRAKIIVQNNVVGSGIGMQARIMTTRYALKEPLNLAIETAWEQWSKGYRCHTGKTLHFCEFERQVMGQVFEAGEVFIRKHYSAVGGLGDYRIRAHQRHTERHADSRHAERANGCRARSVSGSLGLSHPEHPSE